MADAVPEQQSGSGAAVIEAIRKALGDRAAEIEANSVPSDRKVVLTLADEIAVHLRRRMPWSAISAVFRDRGLKISLSTLKSYYRQARRMQQGGDGVARGRHRKRAAGQPSEPPAGAVQAPMRALSGHRRMMTEEC